MNQGADSIQHHAQAELEAPQGVGHQGLVGAAPGVAETEDMRKLLRIELSGQGRSGHGEPLFVRHAADPLGLARLAGLEEGADQEAMQDVDHQVLGQVVQPGGVENPQRRLVPGDQVRTERRAMQRQVQHPGMALGQSPPLARDVGERRAPARALRRGVGVFPSTRSNISPTNSALDGT